MKKTVFFLLLLIVNLAAYAQHISLSDGQVAELKKLVAENEDVKKLYATYVTIADAALKTAPAPVATISSAGLLKGDPIKTATTLAIRDFKKMYALALCYRVSGNADYLKGVSTYLSAWAGNNIPTSNPIDNTVLDPAVEAYDLVQHDLPAARNKLVVAWLKNIALEEIGSIKMMAPAATATNNWNSHRIKTVCEIAFAINDPELKEWAIDNFKKQIARNLLPDGQSIDFKLRDALHYHIYDLEPLIRTAIILKQATGTDYYTYTAATNSSVQKSVDWLLPFVTGEKTHAEYVNTTVKFDIARANNHESGHKLGEDFRPEAATKTLLLASYFEPQLQVLASKMQGTQSDFFDWQCVLNKLSR